MIDYKFSNVFGITYNSGNIQFSKDSSNVLYSPIGNKISAFDIKFGSATTLDIQTRSNIQFIEISCKGILIATDVDGYSILVNIKKNVIIGYYNFREKVSILKTSLCGNYLGVAIKTGIQIFQLPSNLVRQIEPLVLIKSYNALHSDKVSCISWSKDSRFVLTGSKDMTVRLLNLNKIEDYSPFTFSGHKKKVVNCIFSFDNYRIYSISTDGVFFVWKYVDERTEEFNKRKNHSNNISNIKNLKSNLDNDLDFVNNVNKDANDELSEFEKAISKGRYILEKKQQFLINGKIIRCELNSKTNIIVLSTESGVFSIFDLESLENKYTMQVTDSSLNTIDVSMCGNLIALGSKKTEELLVWEWKSKTYAFKNQGHNFDISCVAMSYDSSIIASGGQDGRIKIWDAYNTSCLFTFVNCHVSKVTDIKFPFNKSNMVVASSLDGTVRAFDLIKFNNFRTMTPPESSQLTSVAVDNNAEIVCAGAMDPYSIYVWNLKSGDIVDILSGHNGPISGLVMSTSKDLLLSSSWDKTVRTWSIYSKSGNFETFEHTSEVLSVDINGDNKEFVSTTLKGEVYTWDIETGCLKSN